MKLLLSAFVLLCFANGRWALAPAAWLAPVFLVIFLDSRPPRRGLSLAFLAQLVAFCFAWQGMIPVPGAWYFLVSAIYALAAFVPFAIHRWIRSTLALPVAAVAVELVFQRFATPYGSWASPAYTQLDFLPFVQLVSVAGLAGVHFVIMWAAAVAARVWRDRDSLARARRDVIAFAVVFVAVLAWGQWRVVSAPAGTPGLRVVSLTPSAELTRELQANLEASFGAADRINDDLLERSSRAAAEGADVIVWSEHAARVTRATEHDLVERARGVARSSGASMILGVGLWDPDSDPPFENKIVMIDSEGTLHGVHHKARPIAGQESGMISAGGAAIATMDTGRGRFGIVICHDLDFPRLMREAGRMGVDVLFGPSSDWAAITPLHARMAVFRAVENGCSLVRPCSTGLSLAADPLGSIVASQLDLGDAGNVFSATVPVHRRRTAYAVTGDAFAFGNLAALLLFVVVRVRSKEELA